eukprot:scaffold279084_cov21-Tisochrysis_lutea.AAC.1
MAKFEPVEKILDACSTCAGFPATRAPYAYPTASYVSSLSLSLRGAWAHSAKPPQSALNCAGCPAMHAYSASPTASSRTSKQPHCVLTCAGCPAMRAHSASPTAVAWAHSAKPPHRACFGSCLPQQHANQPPLPAHVHKRHRNLLDINRAHVKAYAKAAH